MSFKASKNHTSYLSRRNFCSTWKMLMVMWNKIVVWSNLVMWNNDNFLHISYFAPRDKFTMFAVLSWFMLFWRKIHFDAIYALLCGEKLTHTFCLWSKTYKYVICQKYDQTLEPPKITETFLRIRSAPAYSEMDDLEWEKTKRRKDKKTKRTKWQKGEKTKRQKGQNDKKEKRQKDKKDKMTKRRKDKKTKRRKDKKEKRQKGQNDKKTNKFYFV